MSEQIVERRNDVVRRVAERVVAALAIAAILGLLHLSTRMTSLEVTIEERNRQYALDRADMIRRLDRIEEKIDRISGMSEGRR